MTEKSNGETNEQKPIKDVSGFTKVRYIQALLLFSVLFLGWSMRINFNMAIVEMTNQENEDSFDWSTKKKSVLLSSFTWGYLVLQVPGGMLATRVGAKWLLFTALFVNAFLCALTPAAAYYGGANFVLACRIIQGLAQGALYPSTHCLISKWIPVEEKARIGVLIYAGANLGMATQYLVAGLIAGFFGWPAIFYVNAALTFAWCFFYMLYGSSSPQEHKTISNAERDYIQHSLMQVGPRKKYLTPWKSIFTSMPFISIILMNIGHNWGLLTITSYLPTYMKLFQGVDTKTNGVVSSIPYFLKYLCSFPFGFSSDYILKKQWVKVTTARKISNTLAYWVPAAALIGLSYIPSGHVVLGVVIYSIVTGINAAHITGFMLVHIDMAPNFAGTLMGITNGWGSFVGLFAPLTVGFFLEDETSITDWRKVFTLLALIYILSNLIFLIFGTCERQPWNEPKDATKDVEKEIPTDIQKINT